MKNNHSLIQPLAIIATFLFSAPVFSQQNLLDESFGIDGKVMVDFQFEDDKARAIAMQPDGNFVVAGIGYSLTETTFGFALARFKTDGSLDTSFNHSGKLIHVMDHDMSEANALIIQPDGKMIAAGLCYGGPNLDMGLVRFNTSGGIDSTFGVNGQVYTNMSNSEERITALALQPDGKIVAVGEAKVSGYNEFAVVRYNTDGSLDQSFSGDGKLLVDFGPGHSSAQAVAIQSDGKIVVGGNSAYWIGTIFTSIRCNPDGSLDNSFGSSGKLLTQWTQSVDGIQAIAIQPDGKIVAAGYIQSEGTSTSWAGVIRYNSDGSMDNTFGEDHDGKAYFFTFEGSRANSVALTPDGKIVLAGTQYAPSFGDNTDFFVARLTHDGLHDNTFGYGGTYSSEISIGDDDDGKAMILQPDGKIIVAGSGRKEGLYDFAIARFLSSFDMGLISFEDEPSLVSVYPNPLQQDAVLKYTLKENENISIFLFNTEGKMIQTLISNQFQAKGEHQQEITFPDNIAAGIYIIKFSSEDGSRSLRIIKQ